MRAVTWEMEQRIDAHPMCGGDAERVWSVCAERRASLWARATWSSTPQTMEARGRIALPTCRSAAWIGSPSSKLTLPAQAIEW
jgi:hypothetical protein